VNPTSVPIDRIDVGRFRRSVSRPAVKALAASMAEIGLLSPIAVFQVGEAYELIAGRHRIEAAKTLGWSEIPAVLFDLADVDRELAEIDENLIRHDLTAAEQAQQTARRKELYLKKHPETKHGGDRGNQHTGGKKRQTADSASCPFTADTAARTGRSERSVQVDAQIGESIPSDVFKAIADTPLADSKTDLLAMARLPEEAQREIVATVDLTSKPAMRSAIAERQPAPKPARPAPHTTEVETTVEAFGLAIASLFDLDEQRQLLALISDGIRKTASIRS
jgi:ParB family transcriptional regulator, chromosome partitioning protein